MAMQTSAIQVKNGDGRRLATPSVLARNLQVGRSLAGWTQHDLAAASGVSRATIAQLEAGLGDPRLSTVIELAAALGVPPAILLAGPLELGAIAGVHDDLVRRPVAINAADLARMTEYSVPPTPRDRVRAARIGASVARAHGAASEGAGAIAGLFSIARPGAGTATGVALARLLEESSGRASGPGGVP